MPKWFTPVFNTKAFVIFLFCFLYNHNSWSSFCALCLHILYDGDHLLYIMNDTAKKGTIAFSYFTYHTLYDTKFRHNLNLSQFCFRLYILEWYHAFIAHLSYSLADLKQLKMMFFLWSSAATTSIDGLNRFTDATCKVKIA